MKKDISIYHGSQQIVEVPKYGVGKTYNDYGQGFYCTENIELAKEWACPVKNDGYANKYTMHLAYHAPDAKPVQYSELAGHTAGKPEIRYQFACRQQCKGFHSLPFHA